jgi:hypothetical protein
MLDSSAMDALTTDHPHFRSEFDWLAFDRDGHVALICSGGYGPVAPTSIEDAEILKEAGELILQLDPVCEIEAIDRPNVPSEYWEIGRRGVFLFDWSADRRRYERLITPRVPLAAITLRSPILRTTAQRVQLPLSFSVTENFGPETPIRSS